jgi:uncharacterized membrane protein
MKNPPTENQPSKSSNRLDRPAWRILSIILVIGTIFVFLYSTARDQLTIPISASVFFLMLCLWPAIWDGIVFLFSKRPQSLWGRISMNLVIATLFAVIFEDLYELVVKFVSVVLRVLR